LKKRKPMTSLILRNEEFLERSLEDPEAFGWEIELINPNFETDNSQVVYGQARHINLLIDMDTGSDIQQEQASVVVRLSTLTIGEPKKNWKVNLKDTSGNEYTCYVVEAMPDRTFGIVILKLGLLE